MEIEEIGVALRWDTDAKPYVDVVDGVGLFKLSREDFEQLGEQYWTQEP